MTQRALWILVWVLAAVAAAVANDRPNVVLIITDDQAWTDYGFMDHPVIETPNIDRLAARGAVFRRAYVPTALCRPSLATIITGLYAHQHKTSGNDPSPELAPLDSPAYDELRHELIANIDRHPTLPRLLGAAGYASFQSGKWWEGSYRRGGFTDGMTRGFPEPRGRHGDDGLAIGRRTMKPVFRFIDRCVEDDMPFFLWYAPMMPHLAHNPPQRILQKYIDKVESPFVAKYYAMCEWFDETCGQLINHIEKREIAENTLIVFIGDNGWLQDPERSEHLLGSKQSPNEAGVRQPMILHWPGVIPPQDRDELASSIDIAPTILSAAGVEIPAEMPGENLLPVVRDGEKLERTIVFGEGFAHDIADLESPEESLLYRWAIEGDWKLILTYDGRLHRYAAKHPTVGSGPRLYNLRQDPHEKHNVAADHPRLVDHLAEQIAAWWPVTKRRAHLLP